MKAKEIFKDLKESPLNSNKNNVNLNLEEEDDDNHPIFGLDDPDDREFLSHKKRNTDLYRAMKNWD
jgi:hypothetical protein